MELAKGALLLSQLPLRQSRRQSAVEEQGKDREALLSKIPLIPYVIFRFPAAHWFFGLASFCLCFYILINGLLYASIKNELNLLPSQGISKHHKPFAIYKLKLKFVADTHKKICTAFSLMKVKMPVSFDQVVALATYLSVCQQIAS